VRPIQYNTDLVLELNAARYKDASGPSLLRLQIARDDHAVIGANPQANLQEFGGTLARL
jgi:hypothetical protein